ncbi:MAG: molybdopterin cofactor-binding domain-containing protein [Dysosmobacter sp.]
MTAAASSTRPLAEAQVHGGMSMGIGYGLSEQLLFDEKTGKPLNNNLLDYKLSTIHGPPGSGGAVCGECRAHLALRHEGSGRAAGLFSGARPSAVPFTTPPACPSTPRPSPPCAVPAHSRRRADP